MKNKEILRSCHSPELPKVRNITTICNVVSWMGPWDRKEGISGKIGEIQLKSVV